MIGAKGASVQCSVFSYQWSVIGGRLQHHLDHEGIPFQQSRNSWERRLPAHHYIILADRDVRSPSLIISCPSFSTCPARCRAKHGLGESGSMLILLPLLADLASFARVNSSIREITRLFDLGKKSFMVKETDV